ncbi:hypothetical protein [Clostridioides sp. ES-S-0048-02]|uniref:hypothetical protein n=1 Tax=Clostridioides sp. ES-S-0048-02 TaxID=2770777 RepID=UPI001D120EDB|nr:hypothetical protein [Clostridioides sp. ES-S-0048-02]
MANQVTIGTTIFTIVLVDTVSVKNKSFISKFKRIVCIICLMKNDELMIRKGKFSAKYNIENTYKNFLEKH